ncbi:MAG: hypothetical protein ABIO43_08080 [Sphingomicrobium sp.]
MRYVYLLAVMVALPTIAAAQSMNAEVFHKRATALQKKGPLALFHRGEIEALMAEGQAAGKRANANRLATVRAGGKPRYCPPEGPRSMNSNEFMNGLAAIPRRDRTAIDMTEATTRIVAKKYPCPA